MYVGDFPLTTLVDTAPARDERAWRQEAYPWRSAGQELASLSFDSSLEPVQWLRAEPGHARVLIFTTTPLSLELEVMADHVVGQIVPPGPGEIVVETPDGAIFRMEADDIGFFDFTGLPRGRVRLQCDTPTGRLVTDWVCL
jgi:hypothetical protein